MNTIIVDSIGLCTNILSLSIRLITLIEGFHIFHIASKTPANQKPATISNVVINMPVSVLNFLNRMQVE